MGVGLQKVRRGEVETSKARWEKAQEEMRVAKEKNKAAIDELKLWCEAHTTCELNFLETREALRGSMHTRFEKYSRLKDAVGDPDAELDRLRVNLEEANEAGVGVWDEGLIVSATEKIKFFEDFNVFKETLDKSKEEPITEPAAREEFAASVAALRDLLKTLGSKKVPIPSDLNEEELLSQADEMLKEP